jgi:hypothetical protein
MIINLAPQRRDDDLIVIKKESSLIINGVFFDFSPLPDNSVLPKSAIKCEFVADDVIKKNGELIISLILPVKLDSSKDRKFPKPIIDPTDGLLEFPK